MARMLYMKDGTHKIDGFMVTYQIFEDGDIEAALKEGWAKTPGESYEVKRKKHAGKADG